MGPSTEHDALDHKAGVGRGRAQPSWERTARWWWLQLAVGVAFLVIGVVWNAPGFLLLAVGPAFPAGFFHNERKRILGRGGQLLGYRRRSRERAPVQWARSTRQWWHMLALGAIFAGVAAYASASQHWIVLPAFVITFRAGFFYNERLRDLGRRSRIPAYRAPA